jgi:hypothetical protein
MRVAFAVLALLGASALIPTAAGAFRGGNTFTPNAEHHTPAISSNGPSSVARGNIRPFCRTVQVGNPRASPPMLVCP